MSISCAITGDKPVRFKFGYKEDYSLCKKIKRVIKKQIIELYDKGVTCFYVGGSLGVDMWAGEIVLRLKEQPGYERIELVVVVPYKGHDLNWDERSRKRLEFLMKYSMRTITAGTDKNNESYIKRNYYIVDNTDYVLAICDEHTIISKETKKMILYAKEKHRIIILIHPDTVNATRIS